MIRVSVLYPNVPGATFDHAYYLDVHRRMVQRLWEPMGLRGIEMAKGVAGAGGSEPPFLVVGHLLFESLADFEAAVEAHGEEILGDIPNFTNGEPTMIVSEIVEA